MKRMFMAFVLSLLVVQAVAVSGLTADEAQEAWEAAKETAKEKQAAYKEAEGIYLGDKSTENEAAAIEAGRESLHAALDEGTAWLEWKEVQADENEDVPASVKASIQESIDKNKDKIETLHDEVDTIENPAELLVGVLKVVGQYIEIVTDVARNVGNMWVAQVEVNADQIDEYHDALVDAAAGDSELEGLLDVASSNMDKAREQIDKAKDMYAKVAVGAKAPLIDFARGNHELRTGVGHMVIAYTNLELVHTALAGGESA